MGLNIWELVIILLIVVLVFGTKKLKTIGGDLGGAIRSFRGAMNEPETNKEADKAHTIDGEAEAVADKKDKA